MFIGDQYFNPYSKYHNTEEDHEKLLCLQKLNKQLDTLIGLERENNNLLKSLTYKQKF